MYERLHRILKNLRNMSPPKEYGKPPRVGPKEVEIRNCLTKNSKCSIVPRELQEKTVK